MRFIQLYAARDWKMEVCCVNPSFVFQSASQSNHSSVSCIPCYNLCCYKMVVIR